MYPVTDSHTGRTTTHNTRAEANNQILQNEINQAGAEIIVDSIQKDGGKSLFDGCSKVLGFLLLLGMIGVSFSEPRIGMVLGGIIGVGILIAIAQKLGTRNSLLLLTALLAIGGYVGFNMYKENQEAKAQQQAKLQQEAKAQQEFKMQQWLKVRDEIIPLIAADASTAAKQFIDDNIHIHWIRLGKEVSTIDEADSICADISPSKLLKTNWVFSVERGNLQFFFHRYRNTWMVTKPDVKTIDFCN